ncbi:hypothetical protein [Corynebacterium guangdongense]|uniref:GerMN domain-containing protein n=1 Tax=Corynebacterium guangdongense TaxID=1783348 RepID=A0ABU2A2K6_9CORY|nr:hypothetical protein [Corynebacterium guangdongense]MDR7330732.1 hypothetical protein [Corynebacterium guangdongense]WJZ16747.1 hypothetical protein CGUA_00690 [Corynebacterium guangdongense]
MATYQLQPARTGRVWWATVGVTLAVLLLPAIVWLFVPPVEPEREPVVLGTGDWEIETDLTCEAHLLAATGAGWDCGGVALETITQPTTQDPNQNLRRMVRALAYTPIPRAAVTTVGEARVLVDAANGVIGMSVQGTGENEGEQIFAVASGSGDVPAISDEIFRAMTGQGLPVAARLEFRDGQLPPASVDELLERLREVEQL